MHISKSIVEGVCEAQGCSSAAEVEIRVPVGQLGEINIVLCRSCKPKFIPVNNFDLGENMKMINVDKPQNSVIGWLPRPSIADHRTTPQGVESE